MSIRFCDGRDSFLKIKEIMLLRTREYDFLTIFFINDYRLYCTTNESSQMFEWQCS